MKEIENRRVPEKTAPTDEATHALRESLSDKEWQTKVEKFFEICGTIDYAPEYDYKEGRWRRTAKLEKLYAEWDQDISPEELETRWKPLTDPS